METQDTRKTPEQIAQITEQNRAKRAREKADLIALNPGLIPVADGAYSEATHAAKNIRRELKQAFPGIKFSVTTSKYSMGDSIRVRWTDGPTEKRVTDIIDRYQEGHFDGMTDYYEYHDSVFCTTFGGTKFVFAERQFSDDFVAGVILEVSAKRGSINGVDCPSVEQWKRGSCHGDWHTIIWRALQVTNAGVI